MVSVEEKSIKLIALPTVKESYCKACLIYNSGGKIMSEQSIEKVIRKSLTGDIQRNALAFSAFINANNISCIRVTDGYWEDKTYFLCTYNDQVVCNISINEHEDNSWYVTGDDDEDNWHENVSLDEAENLLKYVAVCENVQRCYDGCTRSRKTVFGKEFNNVCPIVMKFTNPDTRTIVCMKAVFEARIKYIHP